MAVCVRTQILRRRDGMSNSSTTIATLLGSKQDQFKQQVLDLITQEKDPNIHPVREACRKQRSISTVASVVQAITINNPVKAHEWLHPYTRPFSKPSWRRPPLTDQYYLGVVLGAFQSINWLDK